MPKRQGRTSHTPSASVRKFAAAPSAHRSSPIPRQSLAAAVVERLRDQILNGKLREGEQLRQDAIAAEFQISRIPVREALSHLAAEGLVTIVANRGAVVSALAPEEIEELFETRAVLESYMLRCAIPNFTDTDFQKAEEILKHYEQSLERDSEIKNWGEWNWSFHSTLYAPANRPVMLACIKTLNNNCDRYTRLHLVVTRELHQAGEAHRALLKACQSRNPDVASAALWKHITDAGSYLKEFIRGHRERQQ
jgi:DNA-binding GntR family transcriptional regulator